MEFSYRLEHVLAMADRYGMLTEQQITRFAYLLLSFPTNFAKCTEYAWLAEVLESPASADERLDCITAALTDEENA